MQKPAQSIRAIHHPVVQTVIVVPSMVKLSAVALLDSKDHHHSVDQSVSLAPTVHVTELAVIRNASILVSVLVDYPPNVP